MLENQNTTKEALKFRISSQLKSLIGQDLITDDFVAIFELVKNSFDANASQVNLYFGDDDLYIVDNGKGMGGDDIVDKWLFVAYSAKRDGTEDIEGEIKDYRQEINPTQRYAGSKGVGRFSCDRLGASLDLQSRKNGANSAVHRLEVDWERFEHSLKEEFTDVPVFHSTINNFSCPEWVSPPSETGTILHITSLRTKWQRKKILDLKSALAKLINPFGDEAKEFSIQIHCPSEGPNDLIEIQKSKGEADEVFTKIVNGPVQNFIFRTLQEKTTWLSCHVDSSTNKIITTLTDRGKLIFRISEPLEYPELRDANLECHLYYLNRSAKSTFSRRMGVAAVKFGSVFLFKNGFRVYPIGEAGDDAFGIDRRKQQGHSRYLGTRDIIGRIDVYGGEEKFKESSSRDKGLIETDAYLQLKNFFWDVCFLRLENYVVGVSWKLKFDMDLEDSSFLSGDEAKAKVIDVIAKLASSPSVTVESYAEDILDIISDKIDGFGKTIKNLQYFAEKVGDSTLVERAQAAAVAYEQMQKAEAEAIAFAEREQAARKLAEERVHQASVALQQEKDRNLFLTSLQNRDKGILETLHHQVIIYASNALQHIEAGLMRLRSGDNVPLDEIIGKFERLRLLNQQVISASRFATTANFKLESNFVTEDLPVFVEEYIHKVCPLYESRIDVKAINESGKFIVKFKPIEICIILDNLTDNARKAGATYISFAMNKSHANSLDIIVRDNGFGIPSEIAEKESIFLKGVTTTQGSGLGLHQVRELIEGMGGTISLVNSNDTGTEFLIRIYK